MIHIFLLQFLELPLFHKYLLNNCYVASTLLDQKSMLTGRQIFRGLIHKRKLRQESQRRGSLESVTLWAAGKHTLGMTGIFLPPQAWTCVCALTAWTPARTPGDRPWGQDTGHQDVPTLATFSEQKSFVCVILYSSHNPAWVPLSPFYRWKKWGLERIKLTSSGLTRRPVPYTRLWTFREKGPQVSYWTNFQRGVPRLAFCSLNTLSDYNQTWQCSSQ